MFNFIRSFQSIFQSGCTTLHYHQQVYQWFQVLQAASSPTLDMLNFFTVRKQESEGCHWSNWFKSTSPQPWSEARRPGMPPSAPHSSVSTSGWVWQLRLARDPHLSISCCEHTWQKENGLCPPTPISGGASNCQILIFLILAAKESGKCSFLFVVSAQYRKAFYKEIEGASFIS